VAEGFGLRVLTVDGVQFVHLSGELDLVNADALRAKVQDIAGLPVVVDLSRLRFCYSSGLAALLGARNIITDQGHGFVLRGAQGVVRRLFDVVGLADLLTD
jgi:anti-anti-sigma factor